ncbi:MAG: hypothetical protein CL609_06110 [Anaerolineaceae bacterium]|nr:hypothetical protein [Anaerolineaceae bacterium]
MNDTGHFILSFDTELGTGYFDRDIQRRRATFSLDGSREREAIRRLLDLCVKYQIKATWAVVGHLFYDQCENCDICPILDWQNKYSTFDEVYQTNHPLWYGADVIDLLIKFKDTQEIGFHGYVHTIFNENQMSESEASIEIKEWLRVANRKGIQPSSIVFPRDRAGYHELFQKAGFLCFRSDPFESIWIRNKYFGRYLKVIDYLIGLSKIYVYEPKYKNVRGLIELSASQHLFNFNRGLELKLDQLNLPHWRNQRIFKGIHRIAKEKKVMHLWAHPWEFRTDQDFIKIEKILQLVNEYQNKGQIISSGMTDFATNLSLNHEKKVHNHV